MPWGDVDEIAFRSSLRERLRALPDVLTYEQRMQAFIRMSDIMRNEMALHVTQELGTKLKYCDARADAVEIAKEVNRDLARLGLALKHPEAGKASRLGVVPIGKWGEEKFQIEPIDQADRTMPYRVIPYSSDPKDRYEVIRAPLEEIMQERGRDRG